MMQKEFIDFIDFVKNLYQNKEFIPLHEPKFIGNEKKYLIDCIDSSFVSTVGEYVDLLEKKLAKKVGSYYAVACVNGTSALHIALLLAGVRANDLVITQPLTFVATCNAINYVGAEPVFVDVDQITMGLSPKALSDFLTQHCKIVKNKCVHKVSGKIVKACLPMHTFGHSCQIDQIQMICQKWNLTLVEDSSESLGSYFKDQHTGTFGKMGVFSFNGNKIITSGGGGCLVTDDENLAKRAKFLTTTAKQPHSYEYIHDEIGYNYRMPNLNAALLVAQLEKLDLFLEKKRKIFLKYQEFFKDFKDIKIVEEPFNTKSNYWLQTIILKDKSQRDLFLKLTNENGVMTRPIWKLMSTLPMFNQSISGNLKHAEWLADRTVNIPSGVIL